MSSPEDLSSPPHSPEPVPPPAASDVNVAAPSTGARLTAAGAPRKKPGPKPKPKDPNAPEKKPRKPRKPAEPKDPNAESAPRKRGRAKASLDAAPAPSPPEQKPMLLQQQHPSPTPQTKITEFAVPKTEQAPATQAPVVPNNPVEPIHSNPSLSHMSTAPSTPRPASSGQRYDPIRNGVFETKPSIQAPISPPLNRASASPSITSLIDPPSMATTAYQPQSLSSSGLKPRLNQHVSVTSAPQSPVAHASRPGSLFPQEQQAQPSNPPTFTNTTNTTSTPMEVDSEPSYMARSVPGSVPMKKTQSATSNPSHSNAPTPPAAKPARQKEAPPPLPSGSGLLSGTPFGPAAAASTGSTEPQGVNIWLTFDFKGETNNIINFAKQAEKEYGFQALHPKIAARKERLRQVTAAGAALEKAAGLNSTDDMSVDLSEADSNAEMGGMDDEGSAAGNGKAVKKRKRKQEDYDKEDDFIDDTELHTQNAALMAKDGFFVYQGPILGQGENPDIERADGTVKRGRGRGRGGTTRGETSGRGRGRGGGPGSRGGTTVRKPRVTKADRAQMEQEKLQREQMGATLAAKQPMSYNAPSAAA